MSDSTAPEREGATPGGTKVLIIGAGIGGLTAALALQHFSIPVQVFEQAHELKEIGAGVRISPNGMHALNLLEVGDRLARASGEPVRYRICHFSDGHLLELGPPPESFAQTYGAGYYTMHRADLHTALLDAVRDRDPHAVVVDHTFARLKQDDSSVTAYFANGRNYTGSCLVGCDGGLSQVRADVFGDTQANYTGNVAFRALVPMEQVPAAVRANPYRLFVGPGRSFVHYPLRRNTVMNVLGNAQETRWQAEGWAIPATVEEFRQLFEGFLAEVLDLIASIPPQNLFKWGLRDREPLADWTRGRVTMLGDAAHPTTPYLGQGACIAIEDAMVLGRAMDASGDPREAFARYEAARKLRANGAQLAAREQGAQHHGNTDQGPGAGKSALARGLFSYNPVTAPI
jgi:salicylate hydroxylase